MRSSELDELQGRLHRALDGLRSQLARPRAISSSTRDMSPRKLDSSPSKTPRVLIASPTIVPSSPVKLSRSVTESLNSSPRRNMNAGDVALEDRSDSERRKLISENLSLKNDTRHLQENKSDLEKSNSLLTERVKYLEGLISMLQTENEKFQNECNSKDEKILKLAKELQNEKILVGKIERQANDKIIETECHAKQQIEQIKFSLSQLTSKLEAVVDENTSLKSESGKTKEQRIEAMISPAPSISIPGPGVTEHAATAPHTVSATPLQFPSLNFFQSTVPKSNRPMVQFVYPSTDPIRRN
jgi:hypothetical protein